MSSGPACPKCGLSTWVEIGGGTLFDMTEGIPVYHPNIDAQEGARIDIVCDLEVNDIPLHDEHADRIKAMHFLQHLPYARAKHFLKDCFRVLKPSGSLFLMVGDMEWVFKEILKENQENLDLPYGLGFCVWGEQEHKYDFHKWGYTFNSLKKLLEICVGFTNIQHRGHYNPWEFMVEAFKP